jgi:hypothetical protein
MQSALVSKKVAGFSAVTHSEILADASQVDQSGPVVLLERSEPRKAEGSRVAEVAILTCSGQGKIRQSIMKISPLDCQRAKMFGRD